MQIVNYASTYDSAIVRSLMMEEVQAKLDSWIHRHPKMALISYW
jgi:hypothetical protein